MADNWARGVLKSMDWVKRKGTTEKVKLSPQFFLAEEKFASQIVISTVVYNHDIPADPVIKLDPTPLSYVCPGKYTFNSNGAKNVPIKNVDRKRLITATFALSATGEFLPMRLIYLVKQKDVYQTFNSPAPSRLLDTRKTTGLLSILKKFVFHNWKK